MNKNDDESKYSAVTKKIESIDTKDLEDEILSKNMDNIQAMLNDDKNKLVDEVTKTEFSDYVKDIIDKKGFKIKDVIHNAYLSESYGRHIIGGQVKCKDRDNILKICIGGNFDILETNRALKLCGLAPLYAKNKKDAIIMVAINNKKYDIDYINDLLIENNLEALDIKIDD